MIILPEWSSNAGGIRCEKASSYLIKNNFKDVNQLNGGVINYANSIRSRKKETKFIGKNFVFDNRLGEQITDDSSAYFQRDEFYFL